MSASKNNGLILGTTTDKNGKPIRRWMTPEDAAKAQQTGAGWREGTAAAAPASRAAVVSSPPTPATGLSALASLAHDSDDDDHDERTSDLVQRWMAAMRSGATAAEWDVLQSELDRNIDAVDRLDLIDGSGVFWRDDRRFTTMANLVEPEPEADAPVAAETPAPRYELPPLAEARKMNASAISQALLDHWLEDKEQPLPEEWALFVAGHRTYSAVRELWDCGYLDTASEDVVCRVWDNKAVQNSSYKNDAYLAIAKAENAPVDILEEIAQRANYRDVREAAQAALDAKRGA